MEKQSEIERDPLSEMLPTSIFLKCVQFYADKRNFKIVDGLIVEAPDDKPIGSLAKWTLENILLEHFEKIDENTYSSSLN